MEDGVAESAPSSVKADDWSEKHLNILCAYYMSLGMTYEQFWFGPTDQMHVYERAWELKRDQQNYMLHLQSMYMYRVLQKFETIFLQAKKPKREPLEKYPIPLTRAQSEEIERLKERDARENMIAALMR